MKPIMKKLTCLAMATLLTLTAASALAVAMDLSSAEWEERFQNLLEYAEENDLPLTDDTTFTVSEFITSDGTVGYEHWLDLGGFMKITYYDYGDDVFNSAILSISLDHGGVPYQMAQMAIYFTVLSGDTDTSWEESNALLDALCPIFVEVFEGDERVNGAQFATLRGVGYGMEINDDERIIRLYANVTFTSNDE